MISIAYINNRQDDLLLTSPLLTLERTIEEMNDDIDKQIESFLSVSHSYMVESEIMGELPEEKMLYLEKEGKNIFQTIGDGVIAIGKKILDFITKIIDKLKDIGTKSKSDTEKLELLIKKHPELKNEIICSYKSGELNVSDLKSLKELNDTFDEIVKLSKQKDIDPKSIRGKWEAAKKKFEDAPKNSTLNAALATLAAVSAVVTFKKLVIDKRMSCMKCKEAVAANNEKIAEAIKDLERFEGGKYSTKNPTVSVAQEYKNAVAFLNGQYMKMATQDQKIVDKLKISIDSFLKKHSTEERDITMKAVEYKNKRKERAERNKIRTQARINREVDREDKRNNKKLDAKNTFNDVINRKNAETTAANAHTNSANRRADNESYSRTMGQERGKLDFYKANKDDMLDRIKDEAETRAKVNDSHRPKSGVTKVELVDNRKNNKKNNP